MKRNMKNKLGVRRSKGENCVKTQKLKLTNVCSPCTKYGLPLYFVTMYGPFLMRQVMVGHEMESKVG